MAGDDLLHTHNLRLALARHFQELSYISPASHQLLLFFLVMFHVIAIDADAFLGEDFDAVL